MNFYNILLKCLQTRETVLALTRSPGSSKQLKMFSTTSVSKKFKKSMQVPIAKDMPLFNSIEASGTCETKI